MTPTRLAERLLLASILVGVFACVLAGGRADARRVVHIPTLAELCPGNAEWSKVAECIKRQGAFKLVRDDASVKVVAVSETTRLGGLYVYSLGKQWKLRGELRLYHEHDLLGFDRVTLGKHSGFRLDAGVSMPTSLSLDGETTMPAVVRQRMTLLCFDDGGCTQMMTACDLLLHGKAYYSFRGKVVYANHQIKVVGDRRNAGAYCEQAELVLSDD